MLHAILHRKIDQAIPEPQRLEDALTSTVFGTLILVDAWDIIAAWFGLTLRRSTSTPRVDVNAWFWPRLALAEPDVVIRLGDYLVVVEAKYGSRRSDAAPEGTRDTDDAADANQEREPSDQLVRQFKSITTPLASRNLYAEPLEEAIRGCQLVQVYAVDARRRREAKEELEESRREIPDAKLELAMWQQLYSLLSAPGLNTRRWAADLRLYLERCGLDSFQGVGPHLALATASRRVLDWRPIVHVPRLREIVAPTLTRIIREWRAPAPIGKAGAFTSLTMTAKARDVILGWRPAEGESR